MWGLLLSYVPNIKSSWRRESSRRVGEGSNVRQKQGRLGVVGVLPRGRDDCLGRSGGLDVFGGSWQWARMEPRSRRTIGGCV